MITLETLLELAETQKARMSERIQWYEAGYDTERVDYWDANPATNMELFCQARRVAEMLRGNQCEGVGKKRVAAALEELESLIPQQEYRVAEIRFLGFARRYFPELNRHLHGQVGFKEASDLCYNLAKIINASEALEAYSVVYNIPQPEEAARIRSKIDYYARRVWRKAISTFLEGDEKCLNQAASVAQEYLERFPTRAADKLLRDTKSVIREKLSEKYLPKIEELRAGLSKYVDEGEVSLLDVALQEIRGIQARLGIEDQSYDADRRTLIAAAMANAERSKIHWAERAYLDTSGSMSTLLIRGVNPIDEILQRAAGLNKRYGHIRAIDTRQIVEWRDRMDHEFSAAFGSLPVRTNQMKKYLAGKA